MDHEDRRLLMRHSRISGFTLLEMAITMTVFAILVAAGTASFKTWIANTQIRAASDALQNGLRMAQSESLRRSRQVVFSLTNTSNPSAGFTAVAGGQYWSINVVPSMTDGSETAAGSFVESGPLGNPTTTFSISGPAAICFNSAGRLVANSSGNLTSITNGPSCALPGGVPPMSTYNITKPGAERPLNVQVNLGGKVHMCDPSRVVSSLYPDGC